MSDDLENRVRKLEAAVGDLREAQPTEDAIAERVLARLGAMAAGPRQLGALPPDTAFAPPEELPVRPLALHEPIVPEYPPPPLPKPPSGAVLHAPPPPTDPTQRVWFLAQIGAELRLIARMYFDARYRVSRTAQFAIPVVLLLFVLNYFVFAVWFTIPLIGPILERLICVFLGVFAYKLLARELSRYRDVLGYLSKFGYR